MVNYYVQCNSLLNGTLEHKARIFFFFFLLACVELFGVGAGEMHSGTGAYTTVQCIGKASART